MLARALLVVELLQPGHGALALGGGRALGGPVVGYVLDQAGGASMMGAWFYALLVMGAGSAVVFAVQRHFWRRIG